MVKKRNVVIGKHTGKDLGVSGHGFTMKAVFEKTWENTCLRNSVLYQKNINIGINTPELGL